MVDTSRRCGDTDIVQNDCRSLGESFPLTGASCIYGEGRLAGHGACRRSEAVRSLAISPQLESLPAGCASCPVPASRHRSAATAETVELRHGPNTHTRRRFTRCRGRFTGDRSDTLSNSRCENTPDAQGHAVAYRPELCLFRPARKLDRTRQALASTLLCKSLMPADRLCGYRNRLSPDSPGIAPVIHAVRSQVESLFVSELDRSPPQLVAAAFPVIDCDSLGSVSGDTHIGNVGHIFDEPPGGLRN